MTGLHTARCIFLILLLIFALIAVLTVLKRSAR